uniref:ATP synthase F0 subunit 8 n=1 Tax=Penthe kochi TaxID=2952706 RepID=UPI002114E7F5|nr:ATP synthase F0 subunit 8 [Penthe kochi]USG58925.1 ATP synthase F0 subunit 8 [Penthe kochi]
MPQMMPLNWLMLMIYFLTLFMIFNIMNYYSLIYKSKNFSIKTKNIKTNWKW